MAKGRLADFRVAQRQSHQQTNHYCQEDPEQKQKVSFQLGKYWKQRIVTKL
ncbi:hypothetical protein ACOYX0_07420 [Enterococcus thailandicus]|uniref:hypothetical protein n=1 Tax=Enterococcus thailandicus TaxID=417368 RepID=UPI003BD1E356